MSAEPPREDVARMLAAAGLPGEFRLTALPGGANNRVYRLDRGGEPLLLKAYFRHPDDPRDRLGAEFAFCRFAWDCGLRCLPRGVACDRRLDLGLYEFIDGGTLSAAQIGRQEIQQAADFYRELNRHKSLPAARTLPPGSEACFSLDEHLACVQRRIERLVRLEDATPLGREAAALVRGGLAPAWERVRTRAAAEAAGLGLALGEPLPPRDECLSPSDFGFHNAILATDGRLRFIDFEYAGWDDPAKTVCDFCCQPAVPVPECHAQDFARAVLSDLSDPEWHGRRIALLLPVYRVKWCAIMLNDFLPADGRRRSFARQSQGAEDRRRAQLEKAGDALRHIER
ncbi:MAG: phosphotransferase [Thermoguttaceae bacterium]